MPPPDLHNIYEGKFDSYQLHESIDEFIQRLPPLTTTVDLCPWIWVANAHPEGRDRSGRAKVQDALVPKGLELLNQSLQKRTEIRTKNSQKVKGSITRMLNQESESLKNSIAQLAAESNVLSGKVL
jgi:small nuclear ribonucleoprotein (snRNP)-like protein